MAFNPPVNGSAFTFFITLSDMNTAGSFKSTPTIASGDFKVSVDGAALANCTNIPTVTPTSSVMVKVGLHAAEMTGNNITFVGVDQTSPKEWADICINIITTAP